MLELKKYLVDFKKQLIIGPAFKLLEAIFELIVPLVMASIIDKGIRNDNASYIWQMGGVLLALGILGLCFALICQYCAAIASQGFGTILRNKLFFHINQLSHSELDELGTNTLVTRITNDVDQLQLAVAMLIRLVVRAPFLVIGAIIMAMILDLKLSLIFLIVSPLVALVLYIIMSKSIPFYKVRQEKLDKVSLITRESLTGARVIRAFSKQEKEKARFDEASSEVSETAIRVGKLSAILNPATFAILNLGIIAIIWLGGYQVADGRLTQGQIIAFANYMTQISLALVVVANLVVIFTKASASAARVNEVLAMKSSIVESSFEGGLDTNDVPKVEFKNVSITYHGSSKYVLHDVSFKVEKGETIGIIGGTGSGKTTLVNLIMRFYDASEGEVIINGVSVREYTFKALRGKIGIVPQKAVLFYGSIMENMKWAKEDASKEEILDALKTAQAEEFVSRLPDGLDTLVLQGGKNLSGGQRQRLTIARALVGDPEILILDDSSSALDFATDAKLRNALRQAERNMTVFLVSQRANSIRHADKIIVLDDERVAGIGTHEELIESCVVYKEICLSQMNKEEVLRQAR